MIQLSKKFKHHDIHCEVTQLGQDLNVNIYGGDIPHIGAVALGFMVSLPHGLNKLTSSVSLLTVPGHKEDEIVQKAAKILTKELHKTVVVCCGIHIKDLSLNEIHELNYVIFDLVNELIIMLKST